MADATVPRYTAIPCPRRGCYTNAGQTCSASGTSHRERRLLWVALVEAQSKDQPGVWWDGRFIQIMTALT